MRLRHLWTILGVLCACSSAAESQTPPGQLAREFPFPATAVKQALIDLGAYTGARIQSDMGHRELSVRPQSWPLCAKVDSDAIKV